jgi:hypothetical protein
VLKATRPSDRHFFFCGIYRREKERERRENEGVVRDTTFNTGNRDKFSAMKVPRQCPLVLLVKVG